MVKTIASRWRIRTKHNPRCPSCRRQARGHISRWTRPSPVRCQYLAATVEPSMPASLVRYPQLDNDGRRHVRRLRPSARHSGLEIRLTRARTAVTDAPATVEPGDELIEAVMGRPDETSGFSPRSA